ALLAGDRRDDRIGPAVLGRDHEPLGLQMTDDELGRPRRVVDLHRHEGDVEVARHPLRLVQVEDRRPRLERVVRPGDRDAFRADRLDLLGPRIDERHVLPCAREERAEVAADRACAGEEDLHRTGPPCQVAECTTTDYQRVSKTSRTGVAPGRRKSATRRSPSGTRCVGTPASGGSGRRVASARSRSTSTRSSLPQSATKRPSGLTPVMARKPRPSGRISTASESTLSVWSTAQRYRLTPGPPILPTSPTNSSVSPS